MVIRPVSAGRAKRKLEDHRCDITDSQDVRSTPAPVVNSQERLASIVESSDDATISETLDGTSWNKSAERIFGYAASEVIGKPISFLAWPGNEEDAVRLVETIGRGERVDHYKQSEGTKTAGQSLFH